MKGSQAPLFKPGLQGPARLPGVRFVLFGNYGQTLHRCILPELTFIIISYIYQNDCQLAPPKAGDARYLGGWAFVDFKFLWYFFTENRKP
jgi:hypothetical protein